jgi:hypothetical protein
LRVDGKVERLKVITTAHTGQPLSVYARHRKSLGLPGGTVQAVSKAVKSGRLRAAVIVVDGSPRVVDFAAADVEWRHNTDVSRAPQRVATIDRVPRPSPSRPAELTTNDDDWTRRHERARAMPPLEAGNRVALREFAAAFGLVDDSELGPVFAKGLAAAIVSREPEMMLDRPRAMRFMRALNCPLITAGRRCYECDLVMDDDLAVAEHMICVNHGRGGCEECELPDWPVGQPCQLALAGEGSTR